MFSDPVNIFFSHFIFGGAALVIALVAANTMLNVISATKNRKKQADLAAALVDLLKKDQ